MLVGVTSQISLLQSIYILCAVVLITQRLDVVKWSCYRTRNQSKSVAPNLSLEVSDFRVLGPVLPLA